ncbi:MAG: ATP-binding protein [Thermodesulfobacteriota bacterium]
MRVNLSKKVFLLFVSLTSLTVILAGTVALGLRDLYRAGAETRLVQDFHLQIRELSTFQIGDKRQIRSPDRARFEQEFSRANELLEMMAEQQSELSPAIRSRIASVRRYLGHYRIAFAELFGRYEEDVLLHDRQNDLSRQFDRMLAELPAEPALVLYRGIHALPFRFDEVYHHQELGNVAAMKDLRQSVLAAAADPAFITLFDSLIGNTEALYLNLLGIRDREDFLTDTARHFFTFAEESVAGIAAESRVRQQRLTLIIVCVSLAAVLLTIAFWWRVSRYFRAFLERQRAAIAAIERQQYDYEVGSGVPDDEMGDLARFMKELAASLQRHVEQLQDSERELRQAKEEWERTFDAIGDVVTIQDVDMTITRANQATFAMFNCSPEAVVGRKCYALFSGAAHPCAGCPAPEAVQKFAPYTAEIVHAPLGKTFLVSASPVLGPGGELKSVIHFAKDMTEFKKLEMQFLQAQKMEAIGRLSGGVAHDFNNILSSILGYSELALLRKDDDPGWREDVAVIRQAGEKAAALVRQLLSFSRRRQLMMRSININDTVRPLAKMLLRMIGEDVALDLRLAAEVSAIKADPGQIEQAIMNLAVNARDAMPSGGRLTISTANVQVDSHYARSHLDVEAGPYVMLTVTDNGRGMAPEVQEHVFEPFFTTKQAGKGTGLGLATVYNIVKQHKGFIDLVSEPETGTSFKLYFPATGEAMVQVEEQREERILRYGNETILVVDDEAIIRQIVVDSLAPLGYTLLGAASGEEALQVAASYPGPIDLLFTDLIMPGMDGAALAEKLREIRPGIKLLFMSGYLDVKADRNTLIDSERNFLSKPVMPSNLMRKLREILG